MIVQVRLFARARDLAGVDTLAVDLADGATVGELRRRVAADHPKLAALLTRSAIAVDNDFAVDARVLSANAEVAVLPPVSGGETESGFKPARRVSEGEDIPHRRSDLVGEGNDF